MVAQSKKKILLVDDNPENIKLLKKHLPMYNCVTAINGRTALTLAESSKPDLILLDIMMPDIDGFTVSKRLKEIPETADIPIIFVTAKTNIRRLIKDSCVDKYITAPYDPKDLRQIVKSKLSASEEYNDERK